MKDQDYLSWVRWLPWKWDIQRNDELSGTGDGSVYQAELATPLWCARLVATNLVNSQAEALHARLRALRGAAVPFLLVNKFFHAPKADPAGAALAGFSVSILSAAPGGTAIALSGLPAGFVISEGDKLSLSYFTSPVRYFFAEFSGNAVADPLGETVQIPIFPPLPSGVGAGMDVTLVDPACRVVVVPGSFKIGETSGRFTSGTTIDVIQKR